jgi:hypothetical protein
LGFITLILIAMGVLAYFQFLLQNGDQSQVATLRPIFIIGWVFLSVGLIIWIFKIFRNFLIRK